MNHLNQLGLNMIIAWFLQERLKTLTGQICDEGSQLSSLTYKNCQLNLHALKRFP